VCLLRISRFCAATDASPNQASGQCNGTATTMFLIERLLLLLLLQLLLQLLLLQQAESLFKYDLSIKYREGKKSSADALSRRPSYQLPELAATSSAAAHVRRLLREASSVYAPVQEKLTLAAMKLVGMRVPLMPCHSTPKATPPTTAETIQGDVEAVE